ncbi:MAG: glycosyltransferase family 4 protein [Candidatus Levybacteria bacterium]|nr:glycosyltransferase family 4 protein [Candidatus Levybacteria bacterium]
MRILILGSVALPIPPPAQGGTEIIVYYQVKGLSEKGHKIMLVGPKGTSRNFKDTKVKVFEVGGGDVVAGSLREQKFDPEKTEGSRKLRLEMAYLAQVAKLVAEKSSDYDLILNNMRGEAEFLPLAKILKKPFVNVAHLNIFEELAKLFSAYQTPLITISNSQRSDFPDLNYLATVYNGVDTSKYTFNNKASDYLLMMGSIGRHKNQAAAIRVAKKLGMKLVLAGKIRDKDYFEELKKDIDGVQIKWVGEMGFDQKLKLYQEAKAFLFPILWNEPFGLVMIESLSCGTPVIAHRRGSTSEILRDGLTGFLVADEQMMIEAIKKIDKIKREVCRKHVEDNFTVEKMVDDYEKALLRING